MPSCTLCNLIDTAAVDPDAFQEQTAEDVSRNLAKVGVTLHASSVKRHRQNGHDGDTAVADSREINVLILDIERLKGEAEVEFWTLSDFKNRRISVDDVAVWPRTICVAWKWLGHMDTHFASVWGDGQQGMHQRIWDAVDAADVVIGHNVAAFDMKHLNTGWRDHDFHPPSPYKTVDTLKIARQVFGDESKALDTMTRRIGLQSKTDQYSVDAAKQACAGSGGAQARIREYNEGDIDATEALYLELLPWARSHPHVAPSLGGAFLLCPRCGSEQVSRNGTYSPAVYIYRQYVCGSCGGHFRSGLEARGPSVRAL